MNIAGFLLLLFLVQGLSYGNNPAGSPHHLGISAPEYIVGENYAEIKLEAFTQKDTRDSAMNGKQEILLNSRPVIVDFIHGIAFTTLEIKQSQTFIVQTRDKRNQYAFTIRFLPPWISVLPPLIAILLALLTKEVIISLFMSIFLGALALKGFEFSNIVPALFSVLDKYILEALHDTRHLAVIVFSFQIGGMVNVISHNGGMGGIVQILSRYSHSARSAQLMTFFLSFGIFYDNYANTLIVGNAMRPVTDKFRVSREKLAFIVHCTAASITSIAFISTWIGAELGYINDATANLGIHQKTYSLFLKSLQFAFYPVLMIAFIFFLIYFRKDYGPMNLSEIEARNAGILKENLDKEKKEIGEDIKMLEPAPVPRNQWLNAFLPLLVFIVVAFAGLIITGAQHAFENGRIMQAGSHSFLEIWKHLFNAPDKEGLWSRLGVVIAYSDFYIPLLWSSFAGTTTAVLLAVLQKGFPVRATMEHIVHGFRIMLSTVIILVFAWALADVIHDLHTTDYIASLISAKLLFPKMLPAIVFILAALFSFATGSIWGTMAILYPLILPVCWSTSLNTGLSNGEAEFILYITIASIITGSVFGNQCSPISDTTLVSSISSNCNQVAHIRTQVPYAMTVAGVSLLLIVFSLAGLHWSVNYLIGIALVFVIVKYIGKAVE